MAGVAGRSGGARVAGVGKTLGRPKSDDAKGFSPAGLRPDPRRWLRLCARSPHTVRRIAGPCHEVLAGWPCGWAGSSPWSAWSPPGAAGSR